MMALRQMRWARHVERMEKMRDPYRPLIGNPEGKREQQGRPRHRWEDNIKIDLLNYITTVCLQFGAV
jgi:hypothetical protein